MLRANFRHGFALASLGGLAICLAMAGPAHAQEVLAEGDTGYRTGEQGASPQQKSGAPSDRSRASAKSDSANQTANQTANQNQGPVRMARFSYVKGDITWRSDDTMDWTKATTNLPIRQGAQVWATNGGRANLQFDDGSELRLGNGALATLKVLYSDTAGEFTQITLKDGLATLYVRHDHSVYQIDTPLASVKANGTSQVRVGVDKGVELAVQRGHATVEGGQGKTALDSGKYVYLADANSTYSVQSVPEADSWDRWNSDLDQQVARSSETSQHLPSNIGLVAGNLDDYGTWHDDPKYGSVWAPNVSSPDWRPYSAGNWTWVEPYGWTWVSDEPWGWAPYHYGSWLDEPYGWAWCPGPVNQYWSPGVVDFTYCNGFTCWAPLAPWEVVYPSFVSCGFGFGSWALFFSIGGCGVWYPGGFNHCFCRPFSNFFCNHAGFGHEGFGHEGFGHGGFGHEGFGHGFGDRYGGRLAQGRQFVPSNARNGATQATTAAFGGHGAYRAVSGTAATGLFARGKAFGGPEAGRAPMSGPPSVQPTRESVTPTRAFASARPSSSALQRSVFHTALPSNVSRSLPAGTETPRTASRSSSLAATARSSASNPSVSNMGRTPESAAGRTMAYAGGSNGIGGRNLSAAEAAQRARADLGLSGGNGAFGRSNGIGGSSFRNGGYSGGGYSRAYSGGGHSFGEGRTYSGGYSGGTSRPGGGYSSGEGRTYSGGGYSGGRTYSGGGSYGGGRTYSGGGSYGGGRTGGSSGGGHTGGGGRGR